MLEIRDQLDSVRRRISVGALAVAGAVRTATAELGGVEDLLLEAAETLSVISDDLGDIQTPGCSHNH
jgi:hypothetical protein